MSDTSKTDAQENRSVASIRNDILRTQRAITRRWKPGPGRRRIKYAEYVVKGLSQREAAKRAHVNFEGTNPDAAASTNSDKWSKDPLVQRLIELFEERAMLAGLVSQDGTQARMAEILYDKDTYARDAVAAAKVLATMNGWGKQKIELSGGDKPILLQHSGARELLEKRLREQEKSEDD